LKVEKTPMDNPGLLLDQVLVDEAATVAFGAQLREAVRARVGASAVVYLHGDLGAGKTTLVRGMLRSLNHTGAVKSPTYTLLEPYDTPDTPVFHFDLYRLKSPEELEYLGFDEIFTGPGLKCIEWPEQGQGWLPAADVEVTLRLHRDETLSDAKSLNPASMQRQVSVHFA
jgi:tRNA threonylcarbamoyladenosine biosynthesis protein TsaE